MKCLSWIDQMNSFDLDRFDRSILNVLSEDGRISIADLARRIGLSKTPTQTRLKRLEAEGIITGYRALVDPIRLGLDHVAFVEVKLDDTREAALAKFNAAVARLPEIEQAHMMASHFRLPAEGPHPLHDRLPGGIGREDFVAAACVFHLHLCGNASGQGRRCAGSVIETSANARPVDLIEIAIVRAWGMLFGLLRTPFPLPSQCCGFCCCHGLSGARIGLP